MGGEYEQAEMNRVQCKRKCACSMINGDENEKANRSSKYYTARNVIRHTRAAIDGPMNV